MKFKNVHFTVAACFLTTATVYGATPRKNCKPDNDCRFDEPEKNPFEDLAPDGILTKEIILSYTPPKEESSEHFCIETLVDEVSTKKKLKKYEDYFGKKSRLIVGDKVNKCFSLSEAEKLFDPAGED